MKLSTAKIGVLSLLHFGAAATNEDLLSDVFETLDVRKLLHPKLFKHPVIMDTIAETVQAGKVMVIRNAFRADVTEAMYNKVNCFERRIKPLHEYLCSYLFYWFDGMMSGRTQAFDGMKQHKRMFGAISF